MDNRSRSLRSPWLWIPAVWFGFGLLDAMESTIVMHAEGMHHAWGKLFLNNVAEFLPWVILTAPIMRLNERFPITHWRSRKMWFAHLSACIFMNFVWSCWNAALQLFLNPYDKPGPPKPFHFLWFQTFADEFLSTIILYGAIIAIDTVLDSRARLSRQQAETARLNEQLSQAQLDALRRQIEPHFLFNTLNSVSALIREHRNDAAVMMIAGLSDFLRRLLADPSRQQVPLAEEMEFAQKYLDIQKVRFVDRLQLAVDVPSDLLVAQVPTLILQLMVENAIKHGIAKRAQGGLVRISATRANGTLTLSVYNDGPSLSAHSLAPSGIGLSNMRTRLQGLYGDAFALDMRNRQPGGVEVSVSVPFVDH
jgi:two-component system LytT family sensor kinase